MIDCRARLAFSAVVVLGFFSCLRAHQIPVPAVAAKSPATTDREAAGDSSPNPGPIATDLSSALTSKEIRHAMRKVADWQIQHSEAKFNQQWAYAPLYVGLIATSQTTGDPKYIDAVVRAGERFQWKLLDTRFPHADDQAIGQAYEELYLKKKDPVRIAHTREVLDRMLTLKDDPSTDVWWWCDALFMAPPALAKMAAITGDHRYLDVMDREWNLTTAHLYDPAERLYFRDDSFLNKREANGAKLFRGRGNGWVLAGVARVLQVMQKNDPHRPKYAKLIRDMADRAFELQQQDGLWHTGLLDQTAYRLPEISGSAFITYAMTWGVNNSVLERKKYAPVVKRAWTGMLQYVYADGRLGSIQPVGAAPGAFDASSSYVYGVGAFLLTGSELDQMAKKSKR
jgi:unsaturated rhamnogalacturonyl hydrolase